MHVPDGILSPAVCAGTAVVAASAVAYSLKRMREEKSGRLVPLTSMTAAIIFAGQMVNFPLFVVPVSGHLLGGVLAGVLLGPFAGCVAMTLVLVVQAVLFADGGLMSLGANVLNMGVIGAWGGWALCESLKRWLGGTSTALVTAAVLASYFSVISAAALFCLELRLSGSAGELDWRLMTGLMLLFHSLIGVGEAGLTGVIVGFVQSQQPRFLHGAHEFPTEDARSSVTRPMIAGLLVAFSIAIFVAPWASSNPDGLEAVGEKTGFLEGESSTVLILADYEIPLPAGVSPSLSVSLAGLMGTAVVALMAWGLGQLWRGPHESAGAAGTVEGVAS